MTVNRVGGEGWRGEDGGGRGWGAVERGEGERATWRGGEEESGGEVYAGARRGGGGERVT